MKPIFNVVGHFPDGFMDAFVYLANRPVKTGRGSRIGGRAFNNLHPVPCQTPDPVDKPIGPLYPLFAPFKISFRRGGEQAEETGNIRAVLIQKQIRIDDVLFGFRHLFNPTDFRFSGRCAFVAVAFRTAAFDLLGKQKSVLRTGNGLLADHSLGQKARKRLFVFYQPKIGENPCKVAGIQQVQNGMLNTADVLIHRHPVIHRLAGEHAAVMPGTAVSFEVPGRLHKGIHGVGLSPGIGSTALRTGGVDKRLIFGKRRPAAFEQIHIFRKQNRQIRLRYGNDSARPAMNHGNRSPPVTLS